MLFRSVCPLAWKIAQSLKIQPDYLGRIFQISGPLSNISARTQDMSIDIVCTLAKKIVQGLKMAPDYPGRIIQISGPHTLSHFLVGSIKFGARDPKVGPDYPGSQQIGLSGISEAPTVSFLLQWLYFWKGYKYPSPTSSSSRSSSS